MENFEYESLDLEDDLSFRLVHLFKGEDGPIQCTIFHANLHDVVGVIEYEALSYTWGGVAKQHTIEVDGKEMAVTENLYLALRHLRYTYEDRILWIDAICINQGNHKERGHQVRQMGSIYKRAERVIIWLGAATPETDAVFQFMRRLEQESNKYPCNSWKASDGRWRELWWDMLESLNQLSVEGDGLMSLLHRPWFKRVWIIQEVANARSARVVCGAESVSARIFAIMPSLVEVTPDLQCQSILDIMPGPSRNHSWWIQERDLKRLLVQFQGSEASDPRDHVYALLGVASDAYSNNTLKPDYTKCLADVIKDTVAFLLSFPENWTSTHQLPNWTLSELRQNLNFLANEILAWSVEKNYQATTETLICREDVSVNGDTVRDRGLLRTAVDNGSAPMVKLLLDKGAKVDPANKINHNVLVREYKNNNKQIVGLGLEMCDEPNRDGEKYGKMLNAPLSSRRKGFAKLPMDIRADVSATTVEYGHVLQAASALGDETIVGLLLDKGANVNAIGGKHGHALQAASAGGYESIVKLLLANGADPTREDKRKQTSLSWAVYKRNTAIVQLLLAVDGINVNYPDPSGVTPLFQAVHSGHQEIVELLLAADGINVNFKCSRGETPLFQAVYSGRQEIVELLLAADGIDVNVQSSRRNMPLFQAVQSGRQNIGEFLPAVEGMNVNSPSLIKVRPLFQAIKGGHWGIMESLLAIDGIDTEIPDWYGMTPLSYAALSADRIPFERLRSSSKVVFQPKSILEATDFRIVDYNVLKARLMDHDGVWQDAKIDLDQIISYTREGNVQLYLDKL
jgi:ankyrin repeat protein